MRNLIYGAATAVVAALALAVPAAAMAATGPQASSPGQAGMSVTGARFQTVQASVFLRNGHQYAGLVGGVGGSVSLWASDGEMVLLGISTAPDTPNEPYSAGVTVYNNPPYNGTQPVISQGAATLHEQTCLAGHTCVAGDAFNVPDQQNVTLRLHYNRSTGVISFGETAVDGSTYTGHYNIGVGLSFAKAEVTSDFGTWAGTHDGYLAAPAAQTPYLTWRNTSLTSYSGHTAGLSSWWTRHHVVLAGAPGGAKAGSLFSSGTGFHTYLTP